MMLCLNAGSVAKLVVCGNEFQTELFTATAELFTYSNSLLLRAASFNHKAYSDLLKSKADFSLKL